MPLGLINSGKIFKMEFLICRTEYPSKNILSERHLEDIQSNLNDHLHSILPIGVVNTNLVTLLNNLEFKKKTIQESFSQLEIIYLFSYYYFLLTLR